MRSAIIGALLACALVSCGGSTSPSVAPTSSNVISYVPIDPSVFVTRATAAGWVSAHNEAAIGMHALALWNGLTQPTNQQFRGVPLTVFDTWYTACDIFGVTPTCGHGVVHHPTSPLLQLTPPGQFLQVADDSDNGILSDVRYNQEMKDFVDSGYAGASYTSGSGMQRAMSDGLGDLPDTASRTAMMIKPAYELFSSTQPTVITYWAGPGLSIQAGSTTSPDVPGASTWLKVAVIDPTGTATNAKPVTFCADTVDSSGNLVSSANYTAPAGSYPVIPLSEFYALPVTSGEIAQIQRNRQTALQREAQRRAQLGRPPIGVNGCATPVPPNPVAALVAMHVVTAEVQNVWTWQTFWWTPNAQPLAVGNPQFRHFDFATAYWEVDTAPTGWRYAFNPYLEAGFGTQVFGTPYWPAQGQPGSAINVGRTTNCISCHAQATYTIPSSPSPEPYYVAHGMQPQIPTPQSILVRNLWSVADHAGHP